MNENEIRGKQEVTSELLGQRKVEKEGRNTDKESD